LILPAAFAAEGKNLPVTAPHFRFALKGTPRRRPAVALKSADQIPDRPRVLGGATSPNKSCLDPWIIHLCGGHKFSLFRGVLS
jgi:hypothetical protein